MNISYHCFICCPADFPASEDPGIEPRAAGLNVYIGNQTLYSYTDTSFFYSASPLFMIIRLFTGKKWHWRKCFKYQK